MIRLFKGAAPEILTRKGEDWTRELLAAVEAGDAERIKVATRRYNHPEVKDALKDETKGKCAYCEAKVTDVAHGDIEHVTPKSVERMRTFDWENLTFSCQLCNQNKSDKAGILDPYTEEPSEHIFFAGAFAKGKTPDGARTVLELKLNRIPLIESRNREIERYADQIEKVFLIKDDRTKELLIRGILEDLNTGQPEFVAACLAVVMQYQPKQVA
ncbi:HNH endonuclease [Cereibacter sphaeroides]|uniref:HNH endonuclease n=1 Tax=Cereibacter sphaeroides TaxID=1063 RepID=UPI0015FDC770|nr:HNH endonuclease [Cereibacter sphaeroides]